MRAKVATIPSWRLGGALLAAGLIVMSGSGCRGTDASELRVTLFAAASLSEPMKALERAYEAEHPEVDIVSSFAGSQVLAAQLIEGAPADLFASANTAQLDRVAAQRELEDRRVFATNAIVMVVPAGSSLSGVESMADPGVSVVLAGPEVPAGRYARQALEQLGLREAVEQRVVSNELDVRGVVTKLRLGEADAGLAYATDVRADDQLEARALPPEGTVMVGYELAQLTTGDAATRRAARDFADFITSEAGQAILAAHGFGPPGG